MRARASRLALGFILALDATIALAAVTPPHQPPSGPGGASYAHASVRKQRYERGAAEYWIYEPDRPRPSTAPVIVFSHGWGATNPQHYGAWIEHLVRRGNIVIYPRYQEDLRTSPEDFIPNALLAVQRALDRLRSESGHVRPDENAFALVGHSMGATLSASLAAIATQNGLPRPRAVMCVQPARKLPEMKNAVLEFPDLTGIPSSTLLLTLSGDADTIAGDGDARRIFEDATSVAPANKNFVLMRSDHHGDPALEATHRAPAAPDADLDNGERVQQSRGRRRGGRLMRKRAARAQQQQPKPTVDTLDYYGTWKLFDALCDAAFHGKNREIALGNTPQQRFMGKWSDGVAVRELEVTLAR